MARRRINGVNSDSKTCVLNSPSNRSSTMRFSLSVRSAEKSPWAHAPSRRSRRRRTLACRMFCISVSRSWMAGAPALPSSRWVSASVSTYSMIFIRAAPRMGTFCPALYSLPSISTGFTPGKSSTSQPPSARSTRACWADTKRESSFTSHGPSRPIRKPA